MRNSRLLLLLIVSACGSGDQTIDNVHDICQPLTLVVGAEATFEERAAIADAIALWQAAGNSALSLDPVEGVAQVAIRFEDAAGAFHGVYDDEHGIVYVNHSLPDARARAVTVAHELGHVFGLAHIEGRTSVMNANNLTVAPTSSDWDDAMAIAAGCGLSAPADPDR